MVQLPRTVARRVHHHRVPIVNGECDQRCRKLLHRMNPLWVLMEALEALEENDTNETLRVLHRHQQLTEIDTKKNKVYPR